jgi:hypothetical protein
MHFKDFHSQGRTGVVRYSLSVSTPGWTVTMLIPFLEDSSRSIYYLGPIMTLSRAGCKRDRRAASRRPSPLTGILGLA